MSRPSTTATDNIMASVADNDGNRNGNGGHANGGKGGSSDELQRIISREELSKQKIIQMQTDMRLAKNQLRLEDELKECDRRISFLRSLEESEGPAADDRPVLLSGMSVWTSRRRLTVDGIRAKMKEVVGLLVREEKLRDAYSTAHCTSAPQLQAACASRIGLLKEIMDRYSTLLPYRYLQTCGPDGSGADDGDEVSIRRSKGKAATAYFTVQNVSVDRFDDVKWRIELYVNNEMVINSRDSDSNGMLTNYNSHSGAKIEVYVYEASATSAGGRALAFASFAIVSLLNVANQRIYLEPRGHLDLTIKFVPNVRLRRADAVKRTKHGTASQSTFATVRQHRFRARSSLLPVMCSHCNRLCLEYYECIDCALSCHRNGRCNDQLLIECLPNTLSHRAPPLAPLASFDVPHAFVPQRSRLFQWCIHCGKMMLPLPLAASNVCQECGKYCHDGCLPYVPRHCGLTPKLKRVLPLTTSFDAVSQQQQPHTGALCRYRFIKTIGRGSFGKVVVARCLQKSHPQLVAIKILKKNDIYKHNEAENVQTEYRVLSLVKRNKSPFCLGLVEVFQTRDRVFFVSEFVAGGDLMFHMQQQQLLRQFSVSQVQYSSLLVLMHLYFIRFILAQIVLGLQSLHRHGIVYRDLKLDNVLIGSDGYIKLADFGLSRDGMLGDGAVTRTFCGTPEFMAPEIVKELPYGRAVDWWAFGVCLYEMLLCQAPFPGECESDIYDAIVEGRLRVPEDMHSEGRDLIIKCLTTDPKKRIGAGPTDAEELKRHPFFGDINFGLLSCKKLRAPFIPPLVDLGDEGRVHVNFDEEFTQQPVGLSPIASSELIFINEQINLY